MIITLSNVNLMAILVLDFKKSTDMKNKDKNAKEAAIK